MTLNTAVDDLSKYCNFFTSFAVVHESGSGTFETPAGGIR